jgi:hypothetical protein
MTTDLVTNLSQNLKKISKASLTLLRLNRKDKLKLLLLNRAERESFLEEKMASKKDINRIDKEKEAEKGIINDHLNFLEGESELKENISEEKAKTKVVEEINKKMGNEDVYLDIFEDKTVELVSGWIFHYDSAKYIKTGEKKFMVCGNYPVFISKRTQKIYFFYPGVTLDSVEKEDKNMNVWSRSSLMS